MTKNYDPSCHSFEKKKKELTKNIYFLSYNYYTGKNDDNLSFDSNEIKFSSLFSGESFSSLHDEKTIVQLEFEHGELRRATDHRGGKHVGGRGGGMAEERIASTMHGSRFSILEPLSIVTVERSKEAFSTDAAVYFRDNRIAGTKIMHLNPLPFPNNVFLICFRISWLIIVACNFQVIFERKKESFDHSLISFYFFNNHCKNNKNNYKEVKRKKRIKTGFLSTGETIERTWGWIRTICERGSFPVHPLPSTGSSAGWAKAFGRYHLQSTTDTIQP